MAQPNTEKIRGEAMKHLAKGDLGRALEAYQQLLKLTPNDVKVWVNVGDICRKLGHGSEAIKFYGNAAKKYALSGQLLQAISLNKSILEIDPKHKQTQQALAALYSKSAEALQAESPSAKAKTAAKAPPGRPAKDASIDLSFDNESERAAPLAHEKLSTTGAAVPAAGIDTGGDIDDLFGDTEFDAAMTEENKPDLRSIIATIPKFPIFSDLTAKEFESIIDELFALSFGPGDMIVNEGDPGESFYVICEGSARVVKSDNAGNQVELATLRAGDFFGEFAYMTGTPRTASVMANDHIQLLEFSRNALKKLEAKHPKITETLEQFYRKRIIGTVLKISPLFQSLSDNDRNKLIREFKSKTANKGEVLIEQGKSSTALFMIIAGRVHVSAVNEEGSSASIAELKEGDFFGEISLITGKPATATCTTTTKTRLYELDAARFHEVLQQFPVVINTIRDVAKQRIQELKTKLSSENNNPLAEAGLV